MTNTIEPTTSKPKKELLPRIREWLLYELHDWKKAFRKDYDLYLLILPVVVYFIIFAYGPMYGLQIAFKDYSPALGIEGSPWVGLKHLVTFVKSFYFQRVIVNTLRISLYSLLVSIPTPIILALLFNEIRHRKLRVAVQAASYAPNFISTVVLCSMVVMFFTPGTGFLDSILRVFGYGGATTALSSTAAFDHVYVWSGVWQSVGWSSIIYTAAIAGVPQELYEVATLDGASRLQQIRHITLPCIAPTIIILSILAVGNILGVGYEKVYLLQNSSNQAVSEVISTYVYKSGLKDARYSFASMVGLFNNVINFIVLIGANRVAKHCSDTSLW